METLRKVVVGSAAVAAVAAGGFLAYQQIMASQIAKVKNTREAERLQAHFESNQLTGQATLQSFLGPMKEKLFELTDTTALQAGLRDKTRQMSQEEKVAAWENILVLTLTRVVAGIHAVAILQLLVRVEFNIIARTVYMDKMNLNETGLEEETLTMAQRHRLITATSRFIETGVPAIVDVALSQVQQHYQLRVQSLKQEFTPEDVVALLEDIGTGIRSNPSNLPRFLHIAAVSLQKGIVSSSNNNNNNSNNNSNAEDGDNNIVGDAALQRIVLEIEDLLGSNDTLSIYEGLVDFFFVILHEEMTRHSSAPAPIVKYAAKLESQALSLFITNNSSSNYDNIFLSQLPSYKPFDYYCAAVFSAI